MDAVARVLLYVVIQYLCSSRQYTRSPLPSLQHIPLPQHGYPATHLPIQNPTLPHLSQILHQNPFLRVKHQLPLRPTGAVHALEELPDRGRVVDALLHLARGQVHLVLELRERAGGELLGGEKLRVRGGVGCCWGGGWSEYNSSQGKGRGGTYCTRRRRGRPARGTTVRRARLRNRPCEGEWLVISLSLSLVLAFSRFLVFFFFLGGVRGLTNRVPRG